MVQAGDPVDAVIKSLMPLLDPDDIIIDGDMTIDDSSSGTITFKNLHFRGSAAASNGGKSCIAKSGNTAVKLHFIN